MKYGYFFIALRAKPGKWYEYLPNYLASEEGNVSWLSGHMCSSIHSLGQGP